MGAGSTHVRPAGSPVFGSSASMDVTSGMSPSSFRMIRW